MDDVISLSIFHYQKKLGFPISTCHCIPYPITTQTADMFHNLPQELKNGIYESCDIDTRLALKRSRNFKACKVYTKSSSYLTARESLALCFQAPVFHGIERMYTRPLYREKEMAFVCNYRVGTLYVIEFTYKVSDTGREEYIEEELSRIV